MRPIVARMMLKFSTKARIKRVLFCGVQPERLSGATDWGFMVATKGRSR